MSSAFCSGKMDVNQMITSVGALLQISIRDDDRWVGSPGLEIREDLSSSDSCSEISGMSIHQLSDKKKELFLYPRCKTVQV